MTAEYALKKSDNSNKEARHLLWEQMANTPDKKAHLLINLTVEYLKNEALSN